MLSFSFFFTQFTALFTTFLYTGFYPVTVSMHKLVQTIFAEDDIFLFQIENSKTTSLEFNQLTQHYEKRRVTHRGLSTPKHERVKERESERKKEKEENEREIVRERRERDRERELVRVTEREKEKENDRERMREGERERNGDKK
jgi:hypothetical protein